MELIMLVGLLLATGIGGMEIFAIVRQRHAARIMGTDVLLGEAMTRRGITPADAAAAGRERELFLAASRCAVCAADFTCRAMLSKMGAHDVPPECPNRAFLDDVSAHKASRQTAAPQWSDNNLLG